MNPANVCPAAMERSAELSFDIRDATTFSAHAIVHASSPRDEPVQMPPRIPAAEATPRPRLLGALRQALRGEDRDCSRDEILVRDTKGAKCRIATLPKSLNALMQEHVKRVPADYDRDLDEGCGSMPLANALDRKYSNASKQWGQRR